MSRSSNGSSESPFEPATLVDLLRFRSIHQPGQCAYTFLVDGETEEESLTYSELDRRARAIGAWLQRLGAARERAILLYPPGLDYIAAFFGCLYGGVVAVPAYPPRRNRPDPRLSAIVKDAQATIALTTPQILSDIKRRFVHAPELLALHWLTTDTVDNALAEEWRHPEVRREALAFLQYTSGSTAAPKGVMVSHGNLLHNLAYTNYAEENGADSVGGTWLPPFHDMGLIEGILQPLYSGYPCYLMSPAAFLQRPIRWLQMISCYKVTNSGAPNFAYDLCVRQISPEQRATLDLSRWRVAYNGAEPIRKETLLRFAEAFEPCGFRWNAFYPVYGLAEATLLVSSGRRTDEPLFVTVEAFALEKNRVVEAKKDQPGTRTLVASGRVQENYMKVAIVHPDSLTLCLPGEVGEIWLSSKSVAQGYWNRPDETTHTFQAYLADTGEGPFLRTGDLGFLKDGELFVTGRIKDLIIIRGRNLYPQDIELTVETSHPALRPGCVAAFSVDVATHPCPSTGGEERLVIVQEVERHHLKNLNVDEVIFAIRQAVAWEHEVPVYAVVLIKPFSIPKTSSGKIQRHACRARFLAGSLEVVGEWRMTEELEMDALDPEAGRLTWEKLMAFAPSERQKLLESYIQKEITRSLRLDPLRLDLQKPLNTVGLDSLMVFELKNRLETDLGVVLPMASLMEGPSISQLATQLLARLPEHSPEGLVPIQKVSASPDLNPEQAKHLLASLDQLSDEEVDSLLRDILAEKETEKD